jgi:hypothetical protein
LALEGLLEPIDRRVVSALGDGEMREERRAVLSLLNDLWRAGRGDDEAIASAAQHLLHVLDAKEARRHELPHAGLLSFAERLELRVAAHGTATFFVGNFVVYPHSWSLGLGCCALASRLLPILRRRRFAGLDARHLRLLAA